MLKRLLLAVLFFGLCSPAFASNVSLFGDLFGDDNDGPSAMSHATHMSKSSGHLSITIDISTQQMIVADRSGTIYSFDVSTGRAGHATPTGHFKPVRMNQIWYSSKYENAPMPWSIFFHGGYAIHGTTDIRHLGPRRLAWLRPPASRQRQGPVRPGQAVRHAKHGRDPDSQLAAWRLDRRAA